MDLSKPQEGGVKAGKASGDDTGATARAFMEVWLLLFVDMCDTRICKIKDFCISDVQILSEGHPKIACDR